jgi:broad specificity phosphatase PhoE
MTTTVVLVRHGATEWNETKRAQGQADIPLSDRGRRQAEEIAHQLADLRITAVYASDLERAMETAAPIAGRHRLDVVTDPGFREIDQGEWTGLSTAEIKKRWPDLWGRARHYSTRPGGESPEAVRTRALAALKTVVEAHPGEMVVVVSHGGTIRWISAEALGYDDHESAHIRGLSNGGAVSLHADIVDGKLTLGSLRRLDGASPDLDDPNQ